ncbi:MAG: class III extradiol dioxygenase subunit B-like domain-containing protein [Nocardioidaceae bacterium]
MFVAAAVCPHPPLLVPEVASGAAAELDGLRSACDMAVGSLTDSAAEAIWVVGRAAQTRLWSGDSAGSFAGYGVDVAAGGDVAAGDGAAGGDGAGGGDGASLPLSLTVGAWLLDRAGWTGPRAYVGVSAADPSVPDSGQARVALLVMADGSARRTHRSPGPFDARAVPFDDAVEQALGVGDPAALLALDDELASQLWVAGVPALKALARAATHWATGVAAEVQHAGAPYGIDYVVATWRPAG